MSPHAAVQSVPAGPASVISEVGRKCLRLHLIEGVGPIRFARLLKHFGGVDGVLGASASALERVNGIGRETAERIARGRDAPDADTEVALAADRSVRIVCVLDAEYPPALRTISDPPPCVYVRGTLDPSDALALAIVGARHCTRYGAEQAERFGALAARAGLTVVSGLARGIDSAGHSGALAVDGRTLAVQGCGLCHVYPPESAELAGRIAAQGALLSELPMKVVPEDRNFPRRNRIIAGLSLGVLVVEAARNSGALITARLAGDYNREVFALPGRLDSPHAEGCNAMIQRGEAKLVATLDDILSELGDAGRALNPAGSAHVSAAAPSAAPGAGSTAREALVATLDVPLRGLLDAFDDEPMSIEQLVEASGQTPARVAAGLTTLQLRGLVRRAGGDHFERC